MPPCVGGQVGGDVGDEISNGCWYRNGYSGGQSKRHDHFRNAEAQIDGKPLFFRVLRQGAQTHLPSF